MAEIHYMFFSSFISSQTMASPLKSSLFVFATLFLLLCSFEGTQPASILLTIVNRCRFTIYPAIQPNVGQPVLERGGFALETLTNRSFFAPNGNWSGRIWARTGCNNSNGQLHCATGGCGHRIECNGLGGATPVTLAQFTLHHGGNRDLSSYDVSLVDGFNLPMTVTAHEGKGLCPVVRCSANLLVTCPNVLRVRSPPGNGPVVACKSGCAAFGTDELCCRNLYNSPQTCGPSTYSEFFKRACPATFTYAHDTPSLMHDCASPRELKVIFCP